MPQEFTRKRSSECHEISFGVAATYRWGSDRIPRRGFAGPVTWPAMRPRALHPAAGVLGLLFVALAFAGCGGTTKLLQRPASTTTVTIAASADSSQAAQRLGFPGLATKNTTRVAGSDPIADAAGVALAVYPSQASGTHPAAVTLAPTDDWEAALAASVLMAPPIRAPVLLSGASGLPTATSDALSALAPTGSGAAGGTSLLRVGDVPAAPEGVRSHAIGGSNPYTLAASVDRFQAAVAGRPSQDVVVASTSDPAYAMPAAGWAAESGDPILFVNSGGVPAATEQALASHGHPHIYLLGPKSVISAAVAHELKVYGPVKRVGAVGAAANSVAFATYRDPPCVRGQACAHVPGSFGWAMRSPGHGYTLLDAKRPLDAAASAALSGTGDYGPQLLIGDPSTLPRPVLDFFLNYATPGYTQDGPTVAVYNHGWVIGDSDAVSLGVQSRLDQLLQAVPVSSR